jgi:hydroxyacylglutathione hydrolase
MSSLPPIQAVIVPVTAFQQNCTLLWETDTKIGAFVDPGGDINNLQEIARKHGVKIEKILITHGHMDHCGQAGMLAERLGVPIEGPHEDDKFWIDGVAQAAEQYGMEPCASFVPDRWLHHGETVTVGKQIFDVIHCPGHTPGHVVFYHAPTRLALVGDVLFQGSIGRTDFPRGNHQDLINAITKRLWPLGNDVRFVPGHGAMSTFGQERETNAFVSDDVLAGAN